VVISTLGEMIQGSAEGASASLRYYSAFTQLVHEV